MTDSNYYTEDGEALDALPPALQAFDLAADPESLDLELCGLPTNDLANAERMAKRHPDLIHFTREWGPGVFDGRRFDFTTGEARAGLMAQATARRMLSHEVAAFYETQKRKGETRPEFEQRVAKFGGWALRSGDNSRTKAMLEQIERMLTRPLAEFDANPDRVAVANGTVELAPDGLGHTFTPAHDPRHLISVVGSADYKPGAKCPEFRKFLETVQPDEEVREFLQRVIGYCLTGRIEEQAYFIFHGKGGDGKSTFLTAIEAALGGYVANASIDTFLHRDRKGSDHSADLARLASGPRLVKASEPEQGARLAESVLKVVTGGEPMVTRAMFKNPFEFVPTWKLIISCNRKPKITGGDRGIWRRTLVIPWPVSIPAEDMDRDLPRKLQAEASGILNWALEGWAMWRERGLAPPQAVRDAVDEYRLVSDPFAGWFDACLELGDGHEERAGNLHSSYRAWVAEAGFEGAMSTTAFGRALSERNLQRKRSNGIVWAGASLNAEGRRALIAFDDGAAADVDDSLDGGRGR